MYISSYFTFEKGLFQGKNEENDIKRIHKLGRRHSLAGECQAHHQRKQGINDRTRWA